jgi:hypothetical protein
MQRLPQLPRVDVKPEQVRLGGGLDLISPPGLAAPGTCRFAFNYEAEFGGGYRRIGGFERYDGQPRPSLAEYVVLEAEDGFTGLTPGAQVEGEVSGASGKIIWVSPDGLRIALTRLSPGLSFEDGENVMLADTPRGLITNAAPVIDPFLDNELAYLAAEEYRQFIQRPPGNGPIRGVAILNNQVFAWRDDGAAMKLWKATPTGWSQVDLRYVVQFEQGTGEYLDGGTLTQAGVSAIIRRVVVQSGDWSTNDAEGYFVIDEPIGGNFSAGVAAGTGACTLTGPQVQNSLLAGGRVEAVVHNFTGLTSTRRLYGCDGVNFEFEFDGDVWVPIITGMGTQRAKHVFVHKNHLFYAYGPSLQHSGIAEPYKWLPLFGAGELTTGDEITNLINIAGSESNAALMVTCRDSVWVLYGDDAESWSFKRISDEAGAQPYGGLNMLGPICFDREGFSRYSPTDTFGNFTFESASRAIEPLVRNSVVSCSVLVKGRSKMRCFFADGLGISGSPMKGGVAWMPFDYGRIITVAFGAEIDGVYRVFMGDEDGWVLEADVGRSFDGAPIRAGLRLSSQNQRSNVTEKQYRHLFLQTEASSAYGLAVGAEYSDSNAESANITPLSMITFQRQLGDGLFWDFSSWDQAYWDGSATGEVTYEINGKGKSISLLFSSDSNKELPHTLKTATIIYTPRRIGR